MEDFNQYLGALDEEELKIADYLKRKKASDDLENEINSISSNDTVMDIDRQEMPDYLSYQNQDSVGSGVSDATSQANDLAKKSKNPYLMAGGQALELAGTGLKIHEAYKDQMKQEELEKEARRRQNKLDREQAGDRAYNRTNQDISRSANWLDYANKINQMKTGDRAYYTRQR